MSEWSCFEPWEPIQIAYGTKAETNGTTLRFQSALVDGARFTACLVYILTTDGVYIRPLLFQKRAVFVPWEEVEITKTDYWTTYPYEIHMKQIPRVDFRVRSHLGKKLLQCQPKPEKPDLRKDGALLGGEIPGSEP